MKTSPTISLRKTPAEADLIEVRAKTSQEWKEIMAQEVAALNNWMKQESIPAILAGYGRADAAKNADESDERK